jgi:hypothetical protein
MVGKGIHSIVKERIGEDFRKRTEDSSAKIGRRERVQERPLGRVQRRVKVSVCEVRCTLFVAA